MESVSTKSRSSAPRFVPCRQQVAKPHLFSAPFTDNDRHAMRHGMHCLMYSVMGAHPDVQGGIAGTRFAVWAPNAREVSIVCDANHWQHGHNLLHRVDDGIWTGFVQGMRHGSTYKYSLCNSWGHFEQKADPYGF